MRDIARLRVVVPTLAVLLWGVPAFAGQPPPDAEPAVSESASGSDVGVSADLGPPDPWPGLGRIVSADAWVLAAGRRATDPAALLAATDRDAGKGTSRTLVEVMRGVALYQIGRYAEAARSLERVADGRTPLADLARYFEADAWFHAGSYARAERLFRTFERRFPDSVWRHRATFRAADCQLARGLPGAAAGTLRRALQQFPEYPHRANARFALAEAERARGRPARAAAELRVLIKVHPGDPIARQAAETLGRLEAEGVAPAGRTHQADYDLAYDLYRRRYNADALAAFQRLGIQPDLSSGLRWRVRWMIARCLYRLERFEESLASFTSMVADAPDRGRRRMAHRWRGHSLERLGRFDEAADAALQATARPDKPSAATLDELMWLYFNGAQYEQAAEYAGRLKALGGRWAGKTAWTRAWLAYRLGDYDVAEKAFRRMQARNRKESERYGYWRARALTRRGDIEAAAETYRGIIAVRPLSYYAYQARARLDELGQPVDPEDSLYLGGADAVARGADPSCAEGESCGDEDPRELGDGAPAGTTGSHPTEPLAELARDWGGAFPELEPVWWLAAAGQDQLAAHRLRFVSDEVRAFYKERSRRGSAPTSWKFRARPYLDHREGEPRAEWGREDDSEPIVSSPRRVEVLNTALDWRFHRLMGEAFRRLDDHHYERRHIQHLGKLRGRPESPAYNGLWRRYFPRAFEPVVRRQAAHFGLDPNFVWSLMTVESAYNPYAISKAGARGLMQVMPQTGGLIADRTAWRGFGEALLFEPEVAVEMSAWYFHQLLTKFNGQLPLAIAGYNAGPHRVAAWLERKGHLPMDEFIEEIPYREARRYTKKVLKVLALYRRIYDLDDTLLVSQVIDPAYGDNINF